MDASYKMNEYNQKKDKKNRLIKIPKKNIGNRSRVVSTGDNNINDKYERVKK